MKIQLTEIAQIQVARYLKDICNIKNPTQADVEKEVNDIIATKLSEHNGLLDKDEHLYFVVNNVAIVDPLYDETGRFPLPNPIEYWINMGVNRDVAVEAVENALICAV